MQRRLIPAVLIAAALAGCTSTTTTPTPTPTTPTPSENTLYRQAEANFREFFKEIDRVENAGGSAQPTSRMKELATGPFLDAMASSPAQTKAAGLRGNGATKIVSIQPLSAGAFPGALVGIKACLDASSTYATDSAGKRRYSGHITEYSVYFKQVEGRLKGFDGESIKVDSCDAN